MVRCDVCRYHGCLVRVFRIFGCGAVEFLSKREELPRKSGVIRAIVADEKCPVPVRVDKGCDFHGD
jgi:hypothetical protein